MTIEMLQSKIHRAVITDANLNYVGSITIDKKLLQSANILEGQKVDIVDVNNGERFSTYTIAGSDGQICINGAAARKVAIGDVIIIIAYASMSLEEAKNHTPTIVCVDQTNHIKVVK